MENQIFKTEFEGKVIESELEFVSRYEVRISLLGTDFCQTLAHPRMGVIIKSFLIYDSEENLTEFAIEKITAITVHLYLAHQTYENSISEIISKLPQIQKKYDDVLNEIEQITENFQETKRELKRKLKSGELTNKEHGKFRKTLNNEYLPTLYELTKHKVSIVNNFLKEIPAIRDFTRDKDCSMSFFTSRVYKLLEEN